MMEVRTLMTTQIEKKRKKSVKQERIVKNANFGFVDDYVTQKEAIVELMGMEDETNIPMTLRLNLASMAILDHLVERWSSNRASIASELLDEMIWVVFKKIYEKKTYEEISALQGNLISEFIEKKKKKKGKK
jgi:hypothetical protein